MSFLIGMILGALAFMLYDKVIRVGKKKNHWIIDIYKEDNDES